MKVICPKHISCEIDDCPHKNTHLITDTCDRSCDDKPNSKCESTLKSIREEKLKKLNSI